MERGRKERINYNDGRKQEEKRIIIENGRQGERKTLDNTEQGKKKREKNESSRKWPDIIEILENVGKELWKNIIVNDK